MDGRPSEVEEGIWRVAAPMGGPRGGITVNAYALVGGGERVFVDTAWWYDLAPTHLDELLEASSGQVDASTWIVLTHGHRDHSGFVNYLAETAGAKPWLHRDEEGTIRAMSGHLGLADDEAAAAWYRSHGFPADFARFMVETRIPDTTIDLGDAVWGQDHETIKVGSRAFEVLPSPGHTRGHVSLFEEATGILFSGDSMLPRGNGNPHVTVRPTTAPDPLSDYVEGLEAIRRRRPAHCLPGHGPAVEDVDGMIEHHLAYVDQKLDAVRALVPDQPATAFEIAQRTRWRRGTKRFDELVHDEIFLAFGDILARIRRLETLGHLVASDDDVPRYSVA